MQKGPAPGKRRVLFAVTAGELLVMSLWFSASAVAPQLAAAWSLGPGQVAWLTASVQLGFVVGALASALANLPDRVRPTRLFAVSAAAGAVANAAVVAVAPHLAAVFALRFLTGVTLAGVYPVGMKIMVGWCDRDRGLCVGLLVGALTVGSASPHLLAALSPAGPAAAGASWRVVLLAASALAVAGGALVASLPARAPSQAAATPLRWRQVTASIRERGVRLANLGYLGHMWELYAMWAWFPLFLLASFEAAGLPLVAARLGAFAVIAVGGGSSVAAGWLADRIGRTAVTIASLVVSGSCALVAGTLFDRPYLALALGLLWGLAVIADSAQYSTAIAELADPRYVGTALTVQTSLGFLLTLGSIQLAGRVAARGGWTAGFALLAIGPALGILALLRLRRLPEARSLAGGRR